LLSASGLSARGPGPLEDQAALHGILVQIERLGIELLEVRRLPALP